MAFRTVAVSYVGDGCWGAAGFVAGAGWLVCEYRPLEKQAATKPANRPRNQIFPLFIRKLLTTANTIKAPQAKKH
jgi:hypothetical protein